jgi:hypothetical protein
LVVSEESHIRGQNPPISGLYGSFQNQHTNIQETKRHAIPVSPTIEIIARIRNGLAQKDQVEKIKAIRKSITNLFVGHAIGMCCSCDAHAIGCDAM